MKTIVLYASKTGFTQKYAIWIAEALDCAIAEWSVFSADQFAEYDTIIYGGGLYQVGINGLKNLMKHENALQSKNLIVYATGATPFREETNIEIRNMNFSPEQQKRIPFFYLRGGFDFKKLGFMDKVLMVLLKMKLKMMVHKSPDVKGMLAAYEAPSDFTKKKYIDELVACVNSICT